MKIDNFTQLLEEVFEGNLEARKEWRAYCRNKKFTKESIKQALAASQEKLKQNPNNFYALTLQADVYSSGLDDFDAATDLYNRAIDLGDMEARINCARYFRRKGYWGMAVYLYDKAIDMGCNDEVLLFDRAYLAQGGEKEEAIDYPKAIALYKRCIAMGNTMAMTNLAVMYRNGEGCRVNYREAIALCDRAIALGDCWYAFRIRASMHSLGREEKSITQQPAPFISELILLSKLTLF